MKRSALSWLVPVLSLLVLVGAWYTAGQLGVLSDRSDIPPLAAVCSAARKWFQNGRFYEDLFASLQRVIPGILLGAIGGAVVGVVTGRARLVYLFVGPVLHIWRALPAVATVPFLLIVFGVSEASKITIVALGVFFPVWIAAHEGAGHVDPKYLEVARDLEFTPIQTYRRIILPATTPFIVAGMRTGIAIAYIMVFIGEWIGASRGLGYQLSVAHVVSSTEHMVVGLAALGSLAFLTDAIYRTAIRALLPWMDERNA